MKTHNNRCAFFHVGIFALVSAFCLVSCAKNDSVRVYEEIYVEPASVMSGHDHDHDHAAHAASDTAPVAPSETKSQQLVWQTPEGWTSKANSGMRIGTLYPDPANTSVECSVISLGAQSGSLESNVVRWMGQLGLPTLAADDLTVFLDAQIRFTTNGGFEGILIDLSPLVEQNSGARSMLASIVYLPTQTIFFKLTGPIELLNAEFDAFQGLCQSLEYQQ